MDKKFTHLHLHTDYSSYDGVCNIPALVRKAEEFEYEYLSITDHGTLSGAIRFYEECKKHSIKPVLGVEAYICNDLTNKTSENNRTSHLILLAKNNDGYKNLLKLSHIASKKGFYKKPRLDLSTLEQYKKGLIVLSGCMIGELAHNILNNPENSRKPFEIADKYKSIFGEDYYLEIMLQGFVKSDFISEETKNITTKQKEILIKILEISKDLKIKPVITNDVHYICSPDMVARNMKMKINNIGSGGDKESGSSYEKFDSIYDSLSYHLKSQGEIYKFWEEANIDCVKYLYNAYEISKQCEVDIKLLTLGDKVEIRLPKVEIPKDDELYNAFLKTRTNNDEEETDEVKYVKHLVIQELRKKGLTQPIYVDRLKKELGVVSCNPVFCQDFLIVRDYVKYAKDNNIFVGVGRGSAAGSLILYLLGITGIDPIKFNLNFDRFLSADEDFVTSEKDYL